MHERDTAVVQLQVLQEAREVVPGVLKACAGLGVVYVAAEGRVYEHLKAERLLDLGYRVKEVYEKVAAALARVTAG